MKQKLFTLLTLALFFCSGAWAGEEFTITPSISKDNATLGYGLVTIAKAGGTPADCKFGSSKVQAASSGKTFVFTIQTTYAGVTLKSITFNSIDKLATTDGFTAVGGTLAIDGTTATFTPTGDKNIATFTCVSASGKTGSVKISNIKVDGGTNDIETISTFTGKTDNKFAFTTKKNGETVSNDVIISSSNCSASSNNISFGSSYSFTISANENITFIGLEGDEDITKASYVTTNVTTYSNTAWSGSAKSISFTNGTGGGRTIYKIYLIKEAGVSCTISFDKGEGSGIAPSDIVKNAGNNITLPYNRSMFKDGYTMTGWDEDGDGTADYAPGAVYSVTADATLTAVYTDNEGTTLADRTGATTIKWGSWNQASGVPALHFEGSSGFVVAQATVAGKTIDVKLPIDATSGKFKNQASNDWTQVNPGVVFTIPAVNGATITYKQYDNSEITTPEVTATGNTYELTSAGTSGQLYYEYIQVVLPGPMYDVDFTLSNVTKTSGAAKAEGGTSYTATFAAAAGYVLPASVEVTAGGTDIKSNCTWNKASGTLTIPAAYVTDVIAITINGMAIAGSSIIKATVTATNAATVIGTIGGEADVNLQNGGSDGWKFGGNTHHIGITLTGGKTFQAGDVINVHITKVQDTGGEIIFYNKNQTVIYDTDDAGVLGDNKYVLTDDFDGKTAIYLYRLTDSNNWNAYIDYVEVTRPVSGTISAAGWNTFSCSNPLDLSTITGGTAYYASAASGSSVTLTSTDASVAANEGLMIKGTPGATFTIEGAASGTSISGNKLVGLPNGGTVAKAGTGYNYVFGWAADPADPGFYLINGESATLGAGKAYLHTTGELTEGRLSLVFDEEGDVTGVTSVAKPQTTNNASFYDLQGRRVAQPTKGLYIVNGKKVIIK